MGGGEDADAGVGNESGAGEAEGETKERGANPYELLSAFEERE
jgi:hypothetical protein